MTRASAFPAIRETQAIWLRNDPIWELDLACRLLTVILLYHAAYRLGGTLNHPKGEL